MTRWKEETQSAAEHLGWSVVESDGNDDWQGWGVHLLRKGDEWGVLAWSYGSCGGCDAYEDQCDYTSTPEQLAAVFGDLIETRGDEAAARLLYSDRKGW